MRDRSIGARPETDLEAVRRRGDLLLMERVGLVTEHDRADARARAARKARLAEQARRLAGAG